MVVLSSNQTIYYSQSKEYKQLLAIICIFTNISLLVLEGKANNYLYTTVDMYPGGGERTVQYGDRVLWLQ